MIHDPHESYNPNFPEADWGEYQTDQRTIELATRVKELIDSGLVAKIRNETLAVINFDLKARSGNYSAICLQNSDWYYAHWTALAISMIVHGCFEPNYEEEVIRFYKSHSPNPIKYPPNIEFIEDEYGRNHPFFKGEKQRRSLDQYEF